MILWTLLVAAALAGGAAPDDALRSLLDRVAEAQRGVSVIRADFVQTRHSALLLDPLESSGRLTLERGGRVLWEVQRPQAMRIVITPERASVDGRPLPAPLPPQALGALRSVFGGDLSELQKLFEVRLIAPEGLRMVPRAEGLRRWLEAMEVELDPVRGVPRSVVVEERGGDRAVMEFSAVELDPELPASAFDP